MNAITSVFLRAQRAIFGHEGFQSDSPEFLQAQQAILTLNRQDRKIIERVFKAIDEIMRIFHSSRIPLKNSPPFIIEILPDTYAHLAVIVGHTPSYVSDNPYLRAFLQNFYNKSKDVIKLFKNPGIFNESSPERRALMKLSLTFSNMLFELKAYFPNGSYIGENYRITKREAERFWKSYFGKRVFVTWDEFSAVSHNLPGGPLNNNEFQLLRETMDIIGHQLMSSFEFDVFTRLFYPWSSLLRNWRVLTTAHPGYVAFLTYDEVRQQLEKVLDLPGSYIFRLSCTRPGQWAIGYVGPDRKIYQTIPQNKSLIVALHEGSKEGFYLYPNGKKIKDVDLTAMLDIPIAEKLAVPDDQYDAYCEMGSSFEMCKICDDRNKNVRVEPCGHLLCSTCLSSWQQSENGNTCPFCRDEIKSTSLVVFERISTGPVPKSIKLETESILTGETTQLKSQGSDLKVDFSKTDDNDTGKNDIPECPPPLPPRTTRRTLA